VLTTLIALRSPERHAEGEAIGVDRDDMSSAFWAAFSAANRALATARDEALARHGVAAGQAAILGRLWAADGQSPGELARALDLTTPAVTGTVTKMEAAGLIERTVVDSHHVSLHLTARGRALEKIIERDMRTLAERALGSMRDTERAELIRLLREIRTNVSGG
jgi:DNA-binding MarR family transcriptional regulator